MILPLSQFAIHAEEQEIEQAPSAEFLEFLGEWETDEGEWIDPVEMEDEYLAQQLAEPETRDYDE